MSIRFSTQTHYNTAAIATATTTVTIGPIDIRDYERFSLMYQNNNTAGALIACRVETAYDPSANFGVTGAPNWALVNTTTLPQPSALAASGTVLTTAVENTYAYIRFLVAVSTTEAAQLVASSFRVMIGGFTRK